MKTEYQSKGTAPYRELCTDCGISRSSSPADCATACQFIKPDYPTLEQQIHGRARDLDNYDECLFGVNISMSKAALTPPAPNAQWTGITTSLAASLLSEKRVDAVLTVTSAEEDKWKPVPVLVTEPKDLASCRGMRMGYAPLLALLETAIDKGFKRLAVIGIPCQVYALRSLEKRLGFEQIYVIGTPCSDNTTTENFHTFLNLLDESPETINYLEFRADYQVELRFENGQRKEIPFLQLPISQLPQDFFPVTCRTCVDYTNSLSDITVGYMAGEGEQWIIVRNERGKEIVDLLKSSLSVLTNSTTRLSESPVGSSGKRKSSVTGFQKNTERAGNGLPLRRMPNFMRPIVAWLMPKVGPKGMEFARARLEMKAIETVVYLRHGHARKLKNMVPDSVWKIVSHYGYTPNPSEIRPKINNASELGSNHKKKE